MTGENEVQRVSKGIESLLTSFERQLSKLPPFLTKKNHPDFASIESLLEDGPLFAQFEIGYDPKKEIPIAEISPSFDIEKLKARQAIIQALFDDASLRDYFQEFKDAFRGNPYHSRGEGYYELLKFPRPIDYTGDNPHIKAWLGVLKKVAKKMKEQEKIVISNNKLKRAMEGLLLGPPDFDSEIRKRVHAMNEIVRMVYSNAIPFLEGIKQLKQIQRSDDFFPPTRVDFIERDTISIKGALPYQMKHFWIDGDKPFDIKLDFSKNGLLIVGPNSAGKSTFMETIHMQIYLAALSGYCLAQDPAEIGRIPSSIIRIEKENTSSGFKNLPLSEKGEFQLIMEDLYGKLIKLQERMHGNLKGPIIVFADDILQGYTNTGSVRHFFKKMAELHDLPEQVYVIATIRDSDIAEQLAKENNLSIAGITSGHKVKYDKPVQDTTGQKIVDQCHKEYLTRRSFFREDLSEESYWLYRRSCADKQ